MPQSSDISPRSTDCDISYLFMHDIRTCQQHTSQLITISQSKSSLTFISPICSTLFFPSNNVKHEGHAPWATTVANRKTYIETHPTASEVVFRSMGKLIKNHWARLIILTAAAYHTASSLSAYFWPKFFFDFYTKNLDAAVKPVPILQTINLILALVSFAYEYPLHYIAGTSVHRSIEFRLFYYPLMALAALLLYQGTNAGVYYLCGVGVWGWAYVEGEVVCAVPWTLPRRSDRAKRLEKV
ncbi:hypothetical protein BDV97DRAFT_356301 [Delphinella strobiligena]|nr:hypothetical protein BDV97DRAFT_356301 [Delphinella strobiligena]